MTPSGSSEKPNNSQTGNSNILLSPELNHGILSEIFLEACAQQEILPGYISVDVNIKFGCPYTVTIIHMWDGEAFGCKTICCLYPVDQKVIDKIKEYCHDFRIKVDIVNMIKDKCSDKIRASKKEGLTRDQALEVVKEVYGENDDV